MNLTFWIVGYFAALRLAMAQLTIFMALGVIPA